jgi:hypothetical protein
MEQQDLANEAAAALGAEAVPRGRNSIDRLLAERGSNELLLVARDGVQLLRSGEKPLFFHPSMAAIRLKRLSAGEADPMLSAAQLEPGDRVLDCTAGLGSDAIVFAYAVGPDGTVTALESVRAIAWLVADGLRRYTTGVPAFDTAMRRIRVANADHLAYLRGLPDDSVDIVYFDPMFRHPVGASSSLSPLRELANDRPLAAEAIAEAARVARKTVVLKERAGSGEFARLGFRTVLRSARKLAYGVIAR